MRCILEEKYQMSKRTYIKCHIVIKLAMSFTQLLCTNNNTMHTMMALPQRMFLSLWHYTRRLKPPEHPLIT